MLTVLPLAMFISTIEWNCDGKIMDSNLQSAISKECNALKFVSAPLPLSVDV